MVEAGANEIPEAEILDALDIAHDEIKKLVRGAARAGREGRQAQDRGRGPAGRPRALRAGQGLARRGSSTAATQVEDKLERQDATKAVEDADARAVRGRPESDGTASAAPRSSWPSTSSRRRSSASASRCRRSAPTVAARTRSGRSRSTSRSPRARTARRCSRAARRRRSACVALGTTREEMRLDTLGLETVQALLPPLQLPAVLGRGGRLHARPQAPRHRPRRARRAGARADDPGPGGLPLHDPRRLGHPRVQRLVARWPRVCGPRCR